LITFVLKQYSMAKQVGLIKLSGTLDGVNFYYRKGQAVARKAGGGFNGKAIKTSATMVRVRENNSEFGRCSRLKKVFSDGLLFHYSNRKDVTLHARLMQLFIAVKDCDVTSVRGQRSPHVGLATEKGQKLFRSFEFTAMACPVLPISFDAATIAVSCASFTLSGYKSPKVASHLELFVGVMNLNLETNSATLYKSDSVYLMKGQQVDGFTFSLPSVEEPLGMLFPILFYSFVQELNGEKYPLHESSSFGLSVLGIY
jgi:hypothetical protein